MTDTGARESERSALDLLIRGFQVSQMIRLAADLEIADKVPADGTRDVKDLANASDVLPEPLLRVLRALAAFGIFRVTPTGLIAHSPRSLLLRRDAPSSLHYSARFWAAPGSWKAWGVLDAALTGGVPHEAAWGDGRFGYLRDHPDEARLFDAFMAQFPDDRHRAVATSYDFSTAQMIVDIGGGNGETLRHILATYPGARGVVFDRPDVVSAIPDNGRMAGRITTQAGSFFERIPVGADTYMLIRVLHNWSDEDCARILRACRGALGPGARLLIVDQILEPDPERGHPADYLVDTQMMAMFGSARERTEAEFGDLLQQSGFRPGRLIPTGSPVSIIEAGPI
jgi:O-methyltransferase domain